MRPPVPCASFSEPGAAAIARSRRDAQRPRRLLEAELRPRDEEQELAIAVRNLDERGGEARAGSAR
jgi:hypothetical protein